MNFDNQLFRCSQLGKLMTNGRGKGTMGEACKSLLREIYLKEKYGREEVVFSKYMEKGNICEDDSMDLLSEVVGSKLFKNKKTFENEFVIGTPDNVTDRVIDVKTSWSLKTFFETKQFTEVIKANKDYYWQLMGYMWLTGKERATVAYCLVDTPDELIQDELNRLQYQLRIFNTEDVAYKAAAAQVEINHRFKDIPAVERVHCIDMEYDPEAVEQIKSRAIEARQYLNSL